MTTTPTITKSIKMLQNQVFDCFNHSLSIMNFKRLSTFYENCDHTIKKAIDNYLNYDLECLLDFYGNHATETDIDEVFVELIGVLFYTTNTKLRGLLIEKMNQFDICSLNLKHLKAVLNAKDDRTYFRTSYKSHEDSRLYKYVQSNLYTLANPELGVLVLYLCLENKDDLNYFESQWNSVNLEVRIWLIIAKRLGYNLDNVANWEISRSDYSLNTIDWLVDGFSLRDVVSGLYTCSINKKKDIVELKALGFTYYEIGIVLSEIDFNHKSFLIDCKSRNLPVTRAVNLQYLRNNNNHNLLAKYIFQHQYDCDLDSQYLEDEEGMMQCILKSRYKNVPSPQKLRQIFPNCMKRLNSKFTYSLCEVELITGMNLSTIDDLFTSLQNFRFFLNHTDLIFTLLLNRVDILPYFSLGLSFDEILEMLESEQESCDISLLNKYKLVYSLID